MQMATCQHELLQVCWKVLELQLLQRIVGKVQALEVRFCSQLCRQ